jgi:hypothetical protein
VQSHDNLPQTTSPCNLGRCPKTAEALPFVDIYFRDVAVRKETYAHGPGDAGCKLLISCSITVTAFCIVKSGFYKARACSSNVVQRLRDHRETSRDRPQH